jgi:predicted ribosomally synthesized peptide with SipW-like signal peptide
MKRIILSGGILLFAVAVIAGGTGAFFSDQISSEDNVFTAGSVSLLVEDITHTYNGAPGDAPVFGENNISFSLNDIKPLDEGVISYSIQNGANDAIVCAMVDETSSNDNGVINPETNAGDLSNGAGAGELGAFLSFKIGTQTGSLAALSGVWQPVGTIDANADFASAINYCFGEFSGNDCVLDEDAVYNLAQTDSITADVMFYAVQSRNNDFTCAELNEEQEITNADLYTANDRLGAFLSQDWFFYNDTNDTIMSLNQFSGTGGVNTIAAFTGSNGAAKMVLDNGTQMPDYSGLNDPGNPRYNIATYKFSGTSLMTSAHCATAFTTRQFQV